MFFRYIGIEFRYWPRPIQNLSMDSSFGKILRTLQKSTKSTQGIFEWKFSKSTWIRSITILFTNKALKNSKKVNETRFARNVMKCNLDASVASYVYKSPNKWNWFQCQKIIMEWLNWQNWQARIKWQNKIWSSLRSLFFWVIFKPIKRALMSI